jgi:hypothetical protein
MFKLIKYSIFTLASLLALIALQENAFAVSALNLLEPKTFSITYFWHLALAAFISFFVLGLVIVKTVTNKESWNPSLLDYLWISIKSSAVGTIVFSISLFVMTQ